MVSGRWLSTSRTNRSAMIAVVLWVALVGGSFAWNWRQVGEWALTSAAEEAKASFEKDLVYRRWVAMQGGVYVVPTDQTPPNPYLSHLPDRDVTTTSGRSLTLVNPAYMTRQVHELAGEQYGVRGHITSLKPIRPENAADSWETVALEAFEGGAKEVKAEAVVDGAPYLRYMRPLFAEAPCLKCHAAQGYREGDVRGGISVSVPLAPYLAAAGEQHRALAIGHLFIGGLGVMGLVMGTRRQRAAAAALSESTGRYRRLADAAFEGLMLHEQGVIVDANRAFVRLFGLESEADLIGRHCLDVVSLTEESKAIVRERLREPNDEVFELTAVLRDGTVRSLETQGRAAVYQGRPARMVAMRDITERKQAEDALRRERDRAQSYFDTVPAIIVALDPEGRVASVNQEGCRILGYKEKELVGESWFDTCVRPDDRADVRAYFTKLIRREAAAGEGFENSVLTRQGTSRQIAWRNTVLRDDQGRCVGTLSAGEDITERKDLRTQLAHAQRLESVGRLAGGVAHDFNNMLGVIMGHTDLAMRTLDPPPPLRAHLEEILNAARRSADLTRQLLAFARKQMAVPKVLDLNDTVAGMLRMLRRVIGEDIHLAWAPGADVWPVKIDPAQVDQILVNLCVNARDAIAGAGTIAIETQNMTFDDVSAAAIDVTPGPYVMLAVSDTGRGMQPGVLDRVFEPFFTTKGVGQGTGLGLATVYGIAKQNEGTVVGESEVGRGSVFRVYLRRYDGPPAAPSAVRRAELPAARGETVLLVEDEASVLQMGREMLQSLGYTVLAAATPAAALRIVDDHAGPLHLLVTDVVMPEMDGSELAQRIRRQRPGLRCLFMSGYAADAMAHRGVLGEGAQFLQKPFAVADLAEKVWTALDGSAGA